MKIPDEIKVGARKYKVVKNYQFKEDTDLWGQAHHSLTEIRLGERGAGGSKLSEIVVEETFLHELIHCIDSVYNCSKLDEDTVSRISRGLHQVIADNKLFKVETKK